MKHRSAITLAAASVGAVALALSGAAAATAASTTSGGSLTYSVHPIAVKSGLTTTAAKPTLSLTPAECLAEDGFACQTPDSIRAAYDIPATIDGVPAGTGQTIVIIDAFGSPTVQSDLATFSTAFGLPAADLEVIYPGGKPTFTGHGTQLGWAQETSLDVQWAHAVAPGAKIKLVVAANDSGATIDNAEKYVADNKLGNVLSMSYGEADNLIRNSHANNGQASQAKAAFTKAASEGISLFASSGDAGSDNGAGFANFGFPASDPNVTAVGGTNLWKGSGLDEPNETVWDDDDACPLGCWQGGFGATGGAPSLFDAKQGSDVAYNAAVYTGVLTYLGFLGDDSGLYFMGGTSAGAPQWAALTADVAQATGHSVGNVSTLAKSWAANGLLSDVTVGDNATTTFSGGFAASAGWDAPTGWGTPDVGKIIAALK
ncbi:S53 family peptidase [Gryllotalpicola daejeonensis]|uniref:S53 family peptidase n=1 Tax=Gryllotalpicola daejeonensis TaxID=993087 RepID=A0ABP7ZI59_9MICO